MPTKPDLQDERLVSCLQDEYALPVVQVAFLPVGADRNTAVYRVVAADGKPYLAKLRRGVFAQASVAVPKLLHDQGIAQIIAPLATNSGHLWAGLESFKLILYPFIDAENGYQVILSDGQWRDLGTALKRIHSAQVPPALRRRIQRETFSPQWREVVKTTLARGDDGALGDALASQLIAFLQARHDQILDLVQRAEHLAQELDPRSPEFVLCHSDLHAGNVLIDPGGALYIVDWDDPIFAPKERDLMFIGGGLFGHWRPAQEEETLFYRGYGQAHIDSVALAYYRYERIVQDIAVFCERIVSTDEGREDREQCFRYLASNFLPNNAIELACKSDRTLQDA